MRAGAGAGAAQDRYFFNKPLVNKNLPGFVFSDDVKDFARDSLSSKVAQDPLTLDVAESIKGEFSNPVRAPPLCLLWHGALCLCLWPPTWPRP